MAVAAGLAALFVRLGFWQLDRLAERRSENAVKRARLAEPTVSFDRLRREPQRLLRRAVVEGIPDYANEFVVTGRSRRGSPGVHVMTPLRMPGNDTAVLVNRGWLYAPDAATVDLSRWREDRTTHRGHTEQLPATEIAPSIKGRGVRGLSVMGVGQLLPYPFYGAYLVSHDSGTDTSPARLAEPALDDGPHLSYAIQWFCFAAIALGGAVIVIHKAQGSNSKAQGLL